ncbi:uncharacterized protein LOC144168735 isoform X1 [Haemaphysalis longicornis]
MALLPNKVYWCSQSEDDSEEGLYVGNIVPARGTCVLSGRPGFTCPRFPRQSASNYASCTFRCCCWLSWVGCLSVQFPRLCQGLPWPPAGPKLRPAFPWCSVCFATRKSHSFVCHLAPSHSAHPFKRTSFPRPQALLPFSAPIDYVLAGAHGYFMKHRNSEATTEKRLKAFNGYVANLLRDMK